MTRTPSRLLASSAFFGAALVLIAGAVHLRGNTRGHLRGPVILTESQCVSILGGCSQGDANCACDNGPCGGTGPGGFFPCGTTSTTCVSDGAGGCWMLSTQQQHFCGAPDSNHPNGCNQFGLQGKCGTVYQNFYSLFALR